METTYYEMILCILHTRCMNVHNLPLKPEVMMGESLMKSPFELIRAAALVWFYLSQELTTTNRKILYGLQMILNIHILINFY